MRQAIIDIKCAVIQFCKLKENEVYRVGYYYLQLLLTWPVTYSAGNLAHNTRQAIIQSMMIIIHAETISFHGHASPVGRSACKCG